jgi:hypothetical protein
MCGDVIFRFFIHFVAFYYLPNSRWWMDGWMAGWMDEWMNGWMDGW